MAGQVGIGMSIYGYVYINLLSINNDMQLLVFKGGTLQM